jgi:hypothetical protein
MHELSIGGKFVLFIFYAKQFVLFVVCMWTTICGVHVDDYLWYFVFKIY